MLLGLANKHLYKLNERYSLQKKQDDSLIIQVIDNYQAGNIRSLSSLSGGETFIVSLSLALALSDMASSGTNMDSLFIDEGFGTLDKSSLEMVMDTLENLQQDGKTIGLISHVDALKERIHTQVQLIKNGNGFSTIRVV